MAIPKGAIRGPKRRPLTTQNHERTLATKKQRARDKGKAPADNRSPDYSYDESNNIFDRAGDVLDTEDAFVEYCRSQLLSNRFAYDGLVSQNDAAQFIWDICDRMDDEDLPAFHCPNPNFFNLEPEVQLSFVWFICPHDEQVSLIECLTDLGLQGFDFGYPITSDTLQEAENDVHGFCCSLLPFIERANIDPLVDPNACPSNLPKLLLDTSSPTGQRTYAPNPSPTARPAPSPTSAPVLSRDERVDDTNPTTGPTPAPTDPEPIMLRSAGPETVSLSTGGTIGIALGGACLLLTFGVLAGRRRGKAQGGS